MAKETVNRRFVGHGIVGDRQTTMRRLLRWQRSEMYDSGRVEANAAIGGLYGDQGSACSIGATHPQVLTSR